MSRDSFPQLLTYGEFRVNVDNIDEDVEVYLFHDTQLNLDNYCFCKQGDSISVRSYTDSGFVELARGGLRIRIGDTDTIVRFCKCFCTWHITRLLLITLLHTPPDGPGFHLVNNTFTVSDIRHSPRLLLISSLVIVDGVLLHPASFEVCEVFPDEDGDAYIDSTHFNVSTLTGICESFGWLHVIGLQVGRETLEKEMYVVVVSTLQCENITTGLENFTTPQITIANDGHLYTSLFPLSTPTVAGTVTPTSTPSTRM